MQLNDVEPPTPLFSSSTSKFPWRALPRDLRLAILHRLPLSQLLHPPTQAVFIHDAPHLIDIRIRRLQPLWRAWLDSPLYVRNLPPYRTRAARHNCTPADFVNLERLILGSSNFRGCLTPAIAEFGNLKVLHLDQNDLNDLPVELAHCRSLLLLDCTANCFRRVPQVVMRMRRLKYVVFAQNPQLTALPTGFGALESLVAASFYMCALESIPVELIRKAVDTPDFSLNVAANNLPRTYLIDICERWPTFRTRLTHVMVDDQPSSRSRRR